MIISSASGIQLLLFYIMYLLSDRKVLSGFSKVRFVEKYGLRHFVNKMIKILGGKHLYAPSTPYFILCPNSISQHNPM